jgi:xylan 1,4-beta-xylosidase
MVQLTLAVAAATSVSAVIAQGTPFVCDGSSKAPYAATRQYIACFRDPNVSILGEAKISTVAMSPQYCTTWCGAKGFSYAGIIFGT